MKLKIEITKHRTQNTIFIFAAGKCHLEMYKKNNEITTHSQTVKFV